MEDIETNDIGQSLVDEFVDDNAIEAQEKIAYGLKRVNII